MALRCITVHFSFLRHTVLSRQNTGQLTCSHTSTPESICKSLPAGIVTGGQPSLEHLQELAFGIRELCLDTVQRTSSHLELEPKGIPVWRHIQYLLQDSTKVIWSQLSWMVKKRYVSLISLSCVKEQQCYAQLLGKLLQVTVYRRSGNFRVAKL